MSIYIPPGVKLCSDDMTLHLVLLGPGVTSTKPWGKRGARAMKTKAKLICSALSLSIIIMLPAAIRAESAVLL